MSLSSSSTVSFFVALGCRQLLGSCQFARPQSEFVSVFARLRLFPSLSSSISVFVFVYLRLCLSSSSSVFVFVYLRLCPSPSSSVFVFVYLRLCLSPSSSVFVFVCHRLCLRPSLSSSISVFAFLRLRPSLSSSISVFVFVYLRLCLRLSPSLPVSVLEPGDWSRRCRLSVRCSTSRVWKPSWREYFKFVRYSVDCGTGELSLQAFVVLWCPPITNL